MGSGVAEFALKEARRAYALAGQALAAAEAAGGGLPADDDDVIVQNVLDNTKRLKIDVANVDPDTIATMSIYESVNLAPSGGTFQPSDDILTQISALNPVDDRMIVFEANGETAEAALVPLTSYGRSIAAVDDEAALKALTNLEIGTDVQAYNANLAELAALGDSDGYLKNTSGTLSWGAVALSAYATVGTGGTYATVAAAVTAGATRIALISNVTETGVVGAYIHILLNGYTWDTATYAVTVNGGGRHTGPGTVKATGMNTTIYTLTSGFPVFENLTYDCTAFGGTGGQFSNATGATVQFDNCTILLKNQANPGIINGTGSIAYLNGRCVITGGGSSCSVSFNATTKVYGETVLINGTWNGSGVCWRSACDLDRVIIAATNAAPFGFVGVIKHLDYVAGTLPIYFGENSLSISAPASILSATGTIPAVDINTTGRAILHGMVITALTFTRRSVGLTIDGCNVTNAATPDGTAAGVTRTAFAGAVTLHNNFTGNFGPGNACASTFASGTGTGRVFENTLTGTVTLTASFTGEYGPGNLEGGTFTNSAGTGPILRRNAATDSIFGLATVAGDTLYASAAQTIARLAKGTDGQVYTLASGIPSWATPAAITNYVFATAATMDGTSGFLEYAAVTISNAAHFTFNSNGQVSLNADGKYVVIAGISESLTAEGAMGGILFSGGSSYLDATAVVTSFFQVSDVAATIDKQDNCHIVGAIISATSGDKIGLTNATLTYAGAAARYNWLVIAKIA